MSSKGVRREWFYRCERRLAGSRPGRTGRAARTVGTARGVKTSMEEVSDASLCQKRRKKAFGLCLRAAGWS
ncbi:hypothetical protein N7508_001519 [Penicillium antarcticum]|uniref:uncharacterized protein n=1 Tax=Penicillium antarcticum TaxID=416450 RepID=UPI002394EDAB|nr:uncharacterized protein N7508_001519 [Penicillium antarcticum]KAJ5317011.1 hypothetical protein N7508_001519 [Penicillium antarcticum]